MATATPWTASLPASAPWLPQYGSAIPLTQYASFSLLSSATANTSSIIASSSGYRVLLQALALQTTDSASPGSIKLLSHTTTTQATASSIVQINSLVAGSVVLPYSPVGWFSTVTSEGLDLSVAGMSVVGMITFIYI